jgi:hypothetical protein
MDLIALGLLTEGAMRRVVKRAHSWLNRFRGILICWENNYKITQLSCIWHVPSFHVLGLEFSERL